MILLDTHVLIWFVTGINLAPWTVALIEAEAARGRVLVSAATSWEIPYIIRKGDLTPAGDPWQWFQAATVDRGIPVLDLTAELAWQASFLPGDLHKDPADRFLVATARAQGARLATRDGKILEYGKAGHVRTLAC